MKSMLEYQNVDSELFKLEKQLKNSKNNEQMSATKEKASQAREKMMQLEKEAKKLYEAYTELQKSIDINLKNVEILNKKKIDEMDAEQIKSFKETSEKVAKNLSVLQNKVRTLQNYIQTQIKDFNKVSKGVQTAKADFTKAKTAYDKEAESLQPEIDELKTKLKALEKNVSPELFEKYQKARKDKIFPVFVPLKDKSCGACRMELPIAILNKLKSDKMIECEQCRRYIYIDEN